MKRTFIMILAALCIFHIVCKGQLAYTPMDFVSTSWCTRSTSGGSAWCVMDRYSFVVKDTILNGLTYYKIRWDDQKIDCPYPAFGGFIYLREDTTNRKVYEWEGTQPEQLIYNFSQSIGDTSDFGYCNACFTLTAIDSVLISGSWRRRFCYSSITNVGVDTLVEGIGSICYFYFEGGDQLVKFCKNNITLYQTPEGSYCYLPVSTSNVENKTNDFYYSENNIFVSNYVGTIELFTILGNKIGTYEINGNRQINCAVLPRGTYIAYQKNHPTIRRLKFVKE